MQRRRVLAVLMVAFGLAAGALLPGCSDDGSDSSSDETSEASTTTAGDDTSTTGSDESDRGDGGADLPLVLVTNDDGVGSAGIDALVQALDARDDIEIVVAAPAENQSGQGGKTTEGAVVATEATTASGHPATAVAGFPADSVIWALGEGGIEPDLVISGVNDGQNIGPLIKVSGTVGAARQAAQLGVPAVAASQGFGEPADFPTGVQAVMDWLDANIAAVRDGALGTDEVVNINAPTCTTGEVQGTVEVPADEAATEDLVAVDCTGATTPDDDVSAFTNGWIAVSQIPAVAA